jgi:inosine/xanthosine triphosphatase
MKKIAVGSTNPVKSNSVRMAFEAAFPSGQFTVVGVPAKSQVSDQPMGEGETFRGAKNRAEGARALVPDADFWVGFEGGAAAEDDGRIQVFAWIYVMDRERSGSARTAMFYLPPGVAALIRQGMELGAADDAFFSRANSKHSNGSVGILTDNLIDRTQYYTHAALLALIPFIHPEWYPVAEAI